MVVEQPERAVSHHLRTTRAAVVVRSRWDGRMVMYAMANTGSRLLAAFVPEEVPA
ncbi:MAG: hypothetical protein AB7G37_11180 [Solirubrobacteraceae bacterium]